MWYSNKREHFLRLTWTPLKCIVWRETQFFPYCVLQFQVAHKSQSTATPPINKSWKIKMRNSFLNTMHLLRHCSHQTSIKFSMKKNKIYVFYFLMPLHLFKNVVLYNPLDPNNITQELDLPRAKNNLKLAPFVGRVRPDWRPVYAALVTNNYRGK